MRKLYPAFAAILGVFALLTLLRPSAANAGTGIYPIDATGVSLTMTTPDTYSLCSSGTDHVTITGMPADGSFHLLGHVTVQYVLDGGGRQTVPGGRYTVNTTGNLDLLVSYPPIDQWPVQSNGTAEIHVDIAIEVYVNGIKDATLGPGQQWNVFCLNRPVASLTPTNTPTATPTTVALSATPTSTPSATATNTPTATPTPTTVAPSATPTSTPSATAPNAPTATPTPTTVAPSATATDTPTNTGGVTPSATPTNTPTNGGGHSATATFTPTNASAVSSATSSVSPTAALPAGIPVTGEGPGLRQIGVMLLFGLGTGALALAGAIFLARRVRRAP